MHELITCHGSEASKRDIHKTGVTDASACPISIKRNKNEWLLEGTSQRAMMKGKMGGNGVGSARKVQYSTVTRHRPRTCPLQRPRLFPRRATCSPLFVRTCAAAFRTAPGPSLALAACWSGGEHVLVHIGIDAGVSDPSRGVVMVARTEHPARCVSWSGPRE